MWRCPWERAATLSTGEASLLTVSRNFDIPTSRYQISRGLDGEVNIDVVVGDNIPAPDK